MEGDTKPKKWTGAKSTDQKELRQVSAKKNELAGKMKKGGHGLTIEPHYVPRGSGNNPEGGKHDLHHKIKEWGFVFPSKEHAEKYASSHVKGPQGNIIKKK